MRHKTIIQRISIGVLLLLSTHHSAAANDYLQDQREFQQFKSDHEAEFEAYKKQLQDAFQTFKGKTAKVWGNKNAVVPDKKIGVNYQGRLDQRSIVNFKTGKVKVELALSPAEASDPKTVDKRMRDAINKTLKQAADKRSIIDIAKDPAKAIIKGEPVLQNLVADQQGAKVTANNRDKFIRQQAKNIKTVPIRGNDNKMRVKVSSEFQLIPEHIHVRALRYKSIVNSYAKKMKISPEVIYAVIETESFFNPTARSSAPAFGLMQLVPTSGARDAYRFLFNKDRVVTDRYLYNPDNNIKLGTAFLHKIYYRYFEGIKDPQSRLWASIAAYNTGAGNVFRTFAGKYSRARFKSRAKWKNAALYSINNMSSEEVYQFLHKNLPHKETRRYIKNIRNRMPKYASI